MSMRFGRQKLLYRKTKSLLLIQLAGFFARLGFRSYHALRSIYLLFPQLVQTVSGISVSLGTYLACVDYE